MGDHADDEIYREIHGVYPWQEPGIKWTHTGGSKNPGLQQWNGLKKYMNYSRIVPNPGVNSKAVRDYSMDVMGWSQEEAQKTSNYQIAIAVNEDFDQFKDWWRSNKDSYAKGGSRDIPTDQI